MRLPILSRCPRCSSSGAGSSRGWAGRACPRCGSTPAMLTSTFKFPADPDDKDCADRPLLEEEVLRIDETSKTLVAPQAGGLVTEAAPERDELLALIAASWEA